ncbi:MAG: protein kinase [Myxococcales bacterium]|nr:protein kinase [Myxococcales bacterium]
MHTELGTYTLQTPAGQGGMAVVWRGHHQPTGHRVAVKVITARHAADARYREWFGAEVRAMAGVDHPGVVRILDHGVVPAGHPQLEAGAPWLAMEWLDGPQLHEAPDLHPWAAVQGALAALLRTLAHVHARGLVHRDLKPENVMLTPSGPVLTDFGIAWRPAATRAGAGLVGTPAYMAPEQTTADERTFGPQTDLYALGLMAWELVCGRHPWQHISRDLEGLLSAQRHEPLPPVRPRMAVPTGLDGWLARMAAKPVEARFPTAAHALQALLALPAPEGAPLPRAAPPDDPPLAFDDTTVVTGPHLSGDLPTQDLGPVTGPRAHSTWVDLAPPPLDRLPVPPEPPRPPLRALLPPGLGRSLFALRLPPTVGREGLRSRLWQALRAAAEGQGLQVLWLEGPAGRGKSHLARWLAQSAHACGAAEVGEAIHRPDDRLGEPLQALWRRLLRVRWLAHGPLRQALAAQLALASVEVHEALANVLEGRPVTATERHAVMGQALAARAATGPVLLRLEDVHHAPDTLAWVAHLARRWPDLPVVVVLTRRTDTAGLLDPASLAGAPGERLAVGPMGDDELSALLGGLLALQPTTRSQLVARAAGSPRAALALVRHLIANDALTGTPEGDALRPDAPPMPADNAALWRERIADAVAGPAGARDAFELAAALGDSVPAGDWRAACIQAGVAFEPMAIRRLLDSGLLQRTDDGQLAFAHRRVRDLLLAQAAAADRSPRWHAACAAMMLRQPAPSAGRLADHLLAAGRPDEAAPRLEIAAQAALDRGDLPRARRRLLQLARVWRRLGVRRADRQFVRLRVTWAEITHHADPRRDRQPVRRALAAARVDGDQGLIARAACLAGMATCLHEGPAAGRPLLEEARAAFEAAGDTAGLARVAIQLAQTFARQGEVIAAREHLDAADLQTPPDAPPARRGELALYRADLARIEGRHPDVIAWCDNAKALFRAAGARLQEAQVGLWAGDALRHLGDLAGAEQALLESERLFDLTGRRPATLDANLALVALARHRYAQARVLLERGLQSAHPLMAAMFSAALLPCLAHAGEWAAWDARWAALGPVADGRVCDPDVLQCAEWAHGLADTLGQPARAAQAAHLAAVQAAGLGQPEAAEAWRARAGQR